MLILLQKESKRKDFLTVESGILKDIVNGDKRYVVFPANLGDFYFDDGKGGLELGGPQNHMKSWRTAVPVGTIQFVEAWLMTFHGKKINPIEVPVCLRKPPYVCREYRIVHADGIPRTGQWFVKDVSCLKSFSTGMIRDMEKIDFDCLMEDGYQPESPFDLAPVDKNHLFLVSGFLQVEAEYRAYFIRGKLENLCLYSGDLSVFPNVDLIRQADREYSLQDDYPNSYTMDVMVSSGKTEILEVHPFASVGLYSTLWPATLPLAYKDGIDYYIRHNTDITVWNT